MIIKNSKVRIQKELVIRKANSKVKKGPDSLFRSKSKVKSQNSKKHKYLTSGKLKKAKFKKESDIRDIAVCCIFTFKF